MRKKFVCSSIIFFLLCFNYTSSYAKYVLDTELDVANIELDRTEPQMIYQCWDIVNTYMTDKGKKYDIAFGMIIREKNLAEDKINMDTITTWVDGVETELEIKITETEHTEEEHKYTIEVLGMTSEGYFRMEFARGAVTDVAGWTNVVNVVDMKVAE